MTQRPSAKSNAQPAPTVFISYRRLASAGWATHFEQSLRLRHQIDAFVDVRKDDGASLFPDRLRNAIAARDVFVILLAHSGRETDTLKSAWVLEEIETAHKLGKLMIPIFQESFDRAIQPPNEAVAQLLSYDGIPLLDEQNMFVDETIDKLARMIRNTPSSGSTPTAVQIPVAPPRSMKDLLRLSTLALGLILVMLISSLIAAGASILSLFVTATPTSQVGIVPTDNVTETINAIVAATQAEQTRIAGLATPTLTEAPTVTPTQTAIPSPTAQITETPLNIETEIAAILTADAQKTVDEIASYTKTPTATFTLTDTPTATLDIRASAVKAVEQTRTAIAVASFTKTPTNTPTPTSTFTPSATFTPSSTATPTPFTAGTDNKFWTPVERDFAGEPMVKVPAGCFKMGSDKGDGDEKPVTEVCFEKPYWIDKYEVSNGQFAQFKGQAGRASNWTDANLPRESITWVEATAYCQLRGAVLPTESQWEYAARGPQGLVYPWGNDFNADNVVYSGKTAPVGSKRGGVSWVGAYDLSGNVWEWTSSLYKTYPYDATDGREDQNNRSEYRVLRGGSWFDSGTVLRAANRGRYVPSARDGLNGFRCARSS